METNKICPNCRKPLPPDVPLGLCPECLIKSGFPTGTEPGAAGEAAGTRFVPPPVEEIAQLFPQLEILGFIGKGGMGAVYKARQPTLDRFVALKVLPPAVASDPGFAERFNREARALARLNHPNIVAVHDFGKAGPLHYLLMEFVDGTNLREVEHAGRLSPEQALAIVPQICEALQFAHNEGIVHRDIKPENLLLDKKGRVKITDFGIAKIVGVPAGKVSLTGVKDVVGTPHYMAPEQIEKPQTVDHRADIYSLGVVFYEMLTGELPLGKFQPPSSCMHGLQIDMRLDEVVLRALDKEPARRYQQASVLKTEVETIAGSPVAPAAPTAAGKSEAGIPLFPRSFGLTFTSRIALKVARAGWILGCLAALGFIPELKWMFGFAGFFGLIGAAVLIEGIHRKQHANWLVMVVTVGLAVAGLLGYHMLNEARMKSGPRVVIAETIRREVGRELKEAGASYDDLQVPVAEDRDDGTPFGVNYRGLRNFKSADGTIFNNASGEFIMAYIGGGQWQGALAGTRFTVSVGKVDNIDLPFINDPDVIGEWKSVDFVSNKSEFNPNRPNWKGKLFYQGLTFLENGKTANSWETWTKGIVIHHGDKTASHYEIQEINGQLYMFFEWKSGDVTISGRKPCYYVLKKISAAGILSPATNALTSGPGPLSLQTTNDRLSADNMQLQSGPKGTLTLAGSKMDYVVTPTTPTPPVPPATASTVTSSQPITAGTLSESHAHRTKIIGNLVTTDEFHQDFSQTLPLAADGRLSLNNVNGRIEIAGWDRNEVAIKALKHGKTRESVEAAKITVNSSQDEIVIHTEQPSGVAGFSWSWFWFKNSKRNDGIVDYAIQVPQNARLKNISSVNGNIMIENVSGDIEASAINGEVQTRGAVGDLKLSTVNGRIEAELASLGGSQSVSFSTVNGHIEATLPASADAEVTASTINGGLSSELPALVVKKEFPVGSNLKGTLGNGGAKVKASTVNGRINFRKGTNAK